MFIYIFKCDLFKGQTRKIVSNFPINIDVLYDMVNADKLFPSQIRNEQKWYLAEEL